MLGPDESACEPDRVDGVLITGVASATVCFAGEIELLREGEEGFATITGEVFSTWEGWLAPSGLEGAREVFTF